MKISNVAYYRNNKRVPLKSLDRAKRQGIYPYYGASGVVDHIDDYVFNGTFLLISEDGENLRSRKTPVAFKAQGKFWVNNHAHILEEKEEGILDYLEYYFSQLDLTPYITGAVQPKLNKANLDTIEIPIPPLEDRRAINGTLNSLTDKIQLNHQINQTLEQMAQAIFKSWFVDFEPVKAKIAALEAGGSEEDALLAAMQAISGNSLLDAGTSAAGADAQITRLQAEQPEQYAELRATAELFPSAMQDSELGKIPEGWYVSALSDVADIVMGQSPKGDTYNSEEEGIPLVNGPVEFGSYHPEKLKWTTAPTKLSGKSDLIVCVRGSTTGRFVKSNDVYCLGRGVCAIRAGEFQPYVDRLFIAELPELLSLTTGSTFPSWSGPTLKNHLSLAPQRALLAKYCALFAPVDKGISIRVIESSELMSIRDTLLPKLLSGELSISGAQAQVAEAEGAAVV
jgi:type I restriction enzyme S subunit